MCFALRFIYCWKKEVLLIIWVKNNMNCRARCPRFPKVTCNTPSQAVTFSIFICGSTLVSCVHPSCREGHRTPKRFNWHCNPFGDINFNPLLCFLSTRIFEYARSKHPNTLYVPDWIADSERTFFFSFLFCRWVVSCRATVHIIRSFPPSSIGATGIQMNWSLERVN